MKKIVLVMAVVLSAFAASAQKMATATTESLNNGKASGTYTFVLPDDVDAAKVDKAKAYYKEFFSVDFNQSKHEAKIVLTKNEEMNKRVINRFLVTLGVSTIKVNQSDYTFEELYEAYMK